MNIFKKYPPSELIKRGNAFSQVSVNDASEIKAIWNKYDFEEIQLSISQNDSAKGNCFLIDSFGRESEFYVEVKGISSLSQNEYSVKQFTLDCCTQEIFFTLSS